MRGRVSGNLEAELKLFMPCAVEEGVLLPDCAVEMDGDEFVTLVFQNQGSAAVHLVQLIGCLKSKDVR